MKKIKSEIKKNWNILGNMDKVLSENPRLVNNQTFMLTYQVHVYLIELHVRRLNAYTLCNVECTLDDITGSKSINTLDMAMEVITEEFRRN